MNDPVDLNELRESFGLVEGVPAADDVLALLDAYRITREKVDLHARWCSGCQDALAAADALVTPEATDE